MAPPAASDRKILDSSQAEEFNSADSSEPACTSFQKGPRGTKPPARWVVRLAVWLAVVAFFVVVLSYDVLLMRWRYLLFPEGPKGIVKQIFYGLRDFGQVVPIVAGLLIVARLDNARRGTVIMTVLIAQVLAGVGYNAGKFTIARYRPHIAIEQVAELDQMRVAQTWVGLAPINRDDGRQSFPSGHSAGAFAFAGVLVWFYPRLACVLWPLAAGCALSRYVDGVHWLSDCVAGATIGYVGAWLALRPHVWASFRPARCRSHTQ